MNPICTASFYCRGTSLLALALLIVPSANAADAAVAPSVTAFFQTYCVGCHGPKKQQGDFRVDALKIATNAADAENWQLVLDNLQLGEMPPKRSPATMGRSSASTLSDSTSSAAPTAAKLGRRFTPS